MLVQCRGFIVQLFDLAPDTNAQQETAQLSNAPCCSFATDFMRLICSAFSLTRVLRCPRPRRLRLRSPLPLQRSSAHPATPCCVTARRDRSRTAASRPATDTCDRGTSKKGAGQAHCGASKCVSQQTVSPVSYIFHSLSDSAFRRCMELISRHSSCGCPSSAARACSSHPSDSGCSAATNRACAAWEEGSLPAVEEEEGGGASSRSRTREACSA